MSNMTFSYEDPLNNEKDRIRLLVGDVNEDRPLVYDEEIDAALKLYPYPRCLGVIYRTMANRLTLISKRQLGDQTEDYKGNIEFLYNMASKYETTTSVPSMAKPSPRLFNKGMFDNV